MKLLLDECVPARIRHMLAGHDVFTVSYMRWKGIKNGRLLQLAADDGFESLITTDKGIPHQHDPSSIPITIVVLLARSNSYDDLTPLIPSFLATLITIQPRSIAYVP